MDPFEKQKLALEYEQKKDALRDFLGGFSRTSRWVFGILVLLAIPAYFAAKLVSAQIYLRGFEKTQITAHPAKIEAQSIKILQTEVLTMAGDSYSAYAEIKNPNDNLVSPDLRYDFKFLDAGGKQIGQIVEGKSFLLPGEQKFLIVPNVKFSSAPAKVVVEIADPGWKRRLSIPNVLLKAGIPHAADTVSPDGFGITGNIQNLSPYTVGAVKISAVVSDKAGKIIAVTERSEENLNPQEVREYQMFWPIPLQTQVGAAPKIIVETNVLDPDNLK